MGSSEFPVKRYSPQRHRVHMVRQAHHERKKAAHPEPVEGLCALRGSTGSPRPEPVEGRASAVQTPSPASHKSLKNPKIGEIAVARQAKKSLLRGKGCASKPWDWRPIEMSPSCGSAARRKGPRPFAPAGSRPLRHRPAPSISPEACRTACSLACRIFRSVSPFPMSPSRLPRAGWRATAGFGTGRTVQK